MKPGARAPTRKLTQAPVEGSAEKAVFQLAVYYLPRPTQPPRPVLGRLLPRFPSLRLGGKGAADEKAHVQIVEIPVDKYRPSSLDSLHYFGHELSTKEASASSARPSAATAASAASAPRVVRDTARAFL